METETSTKGDSAKIEGDDTKVRDICFICQNAEFCKPDMGDIKRVKLYGCLGWYDDDATHFRPYPDELISGFPFEVVE